jgi:tetratricopeptide (TPR) repeat protein
MTVLVVGALALAAGARRESRNTRTERDRADAALGQAERSLSVARHAVGRFLLEAGIADLEDRPLPPPGRRALLESALDFYATDTRQDEDGLLACARILHELHRYEEALSIFDRVLTAAPRNVEWIVGRGHMLFHLRRHDAALAAFDAAIAIDPGYAEAHDYRGLTLYSLGRFGHALDAHDRAIALAPNAPRYHVNRAGTLNHGLGRPHDALEASDRSLAIRPNSPSGHATRGDALYALGRFAEALAAHERALAFDPDSVNAHTGRGNALLPLGQASASLESYERALALDPTYVWAHMGRGNALLALGRFEDAVDAHRAAVRIRPHLAEARANLGNSLASTGAFGSAIREYQAAIEIRADYAAAHRGLGLALLSVGRARQALPSLRKGEEFGSARPGWVSLPAEILESAEQQAAAEERLDQVLSGKAEPRDAAERVAFAKILYGWARHAEAARMWADAFAEDAALAEDLGPHHRYNAACSAALAAAPPGDDAAAWRAQALEWLRADLAAREKAGLAATLANWKRDPDFAAVRDRLPELPAAEREEWTRLWAGVDAALARAGS